MSFVLLSFFGGVHDVPADSISISWHEAHNNKNLLVESNAMTLFRGALRGENILLRTDDFMEETEVRKRAVVALSGSNEFDLKINLFNCEDDCEWRIALTEIRNTNSAMVSEICQSTPSTMEAQYEKYFFCRKAFGFHHAARGQCWPEAASALAGWFDSAYQLYTSTERDKMSFIDRDGNVEHKVRDALVKCSEFEGLAGRNPGYFLGMIHNLDVTTLAMAQRIERYLSTDMEPSARALAEELVQQVQSVSIRSRIPSKDAKYVEDIVNRALRPSGRYVLP